MSAVQGLLGALLEEESSQGGNAVGTPLDYSDLTMFLDAENDTFGSGGDITSWDDQSSASITFDIPAGGRAPIFIANAQNGLPGVEFDEAPSGSDALARKLSSDDLVFANYFSSGGNPGERSIGFAARLTDINNSQSTDNTLISKGFYDSNGWRVSVQSNGTFIFQHRRSDGTVYAVTANGFYANGDVVLGSISWTGANTSGSFFLRLFDQTNFVEVGSITTGTSNVIGAEVARELIIGNVVDTGNASRQEPWGGQVMGIWMVKPGSTVFDVSYQNRWIVP